MPLFSTTLDALSLSLALFIVLVIGVVLRSPSMFTGRHGRRHRIMGLLLLLFTTCSIAHLAVTTCWPGADGGWAPRSFLAHDVILGVLGIATTLTAASDFRYLSRAKNVASGTLDEAATVTFSEMLEHSFYQMLNLAQVAFLHALPHAEGALALLVSMVPGWVGDDMVVPWWGGHGGVVAFRGALALLVTAPWLARRLFPVNRFSDNYTTSLRDPWALTSVMYRAKKYQYLLYKHCLLHGLNVSLAIDGDGSSSSSSSSSNGSSGGGLADSRHFRLYWTALNVSYVMEFFLQTLVKRKYMTQTMLIRLQVLLMLVASVAAFSVLRVVRPSVALLSLLLNMCHRGHDVANTVVVGVVVGGLVAPWTRY